MVPSSSRRRVPFTSAGCPGRVPGGVDCVSLRAREHGHLASTDISHGERDLTAEWRVSQVSFDVVIAIQISATVTSGRVLRR